MGTGSSSWQSEDGGPNSRRGGETPSSCATPTSASFPSEPEVDADVGVNADGSNATAPYPCQFCDRTFPRLSYLKKHEQVSTGGLLLLLLRYSFFLPSSSSNRLSCLHFYISFITLQIVTFGERYFFHRFIIIFFLWRIRESQNIVVIIGIIYFPFIFSLQRLYICVYIWKWSDQSSFSTAKIIYIYIYLETNDII